MKITNTKVPGITTLRLLTALSLSLLSAIVFAADQEIAPLPTPIGSAQIMNVGTGLFAVIATIVLVGFIYSRSKGLNGKAGSVIDVVAVQPLGPKERIVLVQVADKQLMLGMTSTQVQTLHVFDEPVVVATAEAAGLSFADRLKQVMPGNRK